MQQLIQFELQVAQQEQGSNILIGQLQSWPEWEKIETLFNHWLNTYQFTILECITGADRVSWRLSLDQVYFYFHVESLSESCWFEYDDGLNFEQNLICSDNNPKNKPKNASFALWLLDYLNSKTV
ncbi:DUF3630 family protein [Catenovulum sp. 2E275]|uniref:DUF3630 family protein n=1 Tax=Catenovulum sp. 2E275 TaxID=2980497 RepID=UPI0021CFB2A6|nr:DUF3630 family protein [Catenovulum sp. 2E275]MCU4676317.1 DUF3630 family protein [Catenovulum sp. 2E275]